MVLQQNSSPVTWFSFQVDTGTLQALHPRPRPLTYLAAMPQFRYLLLALQLGSTALTAQTNDTTALSRLLDNYKLKATVGLQLWSSYSAGLSVYDSETETYTAVENRINTQLKRSRFIVSGQPYETVKFQVIMALDFVGRDVLSSTDAGFNNGGSPIFRVWNVFVDWQLARGSDGAYLSAGYFPSPIGRESNTPALRSTSYEKAWSQNYLRRHLVGTGPGRAAGLLFGGQLHADSGRRHLTYDLALQNAYVNVLGGNSTGRQASPLVTGRLSFTLGDAESETYTPVHKVNYFGKRTGVTLSVGGARQGRTDLFRENVAYGLELLANHAGFHLDGDVYRMRRTGQGISTEGTTGYLRAGKNLNLPRQVVLEPVVSYWFYRGPTSAGEVGNARRLSDFAGKDNGLDVGANLYFNPNFKLSGFFALREGSAGEGDPATIMNNFYQQPGVGAIERGNYGGLGLVVIF